MIDEDSTYNPLDESPKPSPIPLNVLPATVAELRAECETHRRRIVEAMQRGEKFYPCTLENFAAILKGEASGYYLPPLERLWHAATALDVKDGPPFPGESQTALECVTALDGLIGACGANTPALAAECTPTDRPTMTREECEDPARRFLDANPDATIKAVAESVGAATGTVHKTAAWKKNMERRKANRPASGRQPRQLVNGEQSSYLADNREPVDELIDAEEADEVSWRRLMELATAKQRGVLNSLDEKGKAALLEYVRGGHSDDKVKVMIGMIVDQSDDESSERRDKRRSRSRS